MDRYQQLFEEFKNEAPQSNNSRLLLLDGLNMYIRVWAAVPALNENGDHVGGIVGFLRSLGSIIKTIKPTRCILVFDGKGGSVKRRKIFSDYKMGVRKKTNYNRFSEFTSPETERESMGMQLSRLMDYLQHFPIDCISVDSVEADDVIGYIANDLMYSQFDEIVISSSDRDYFQLIDDKIKVYNPIKKILFDKNEVFNIHGIIQDNYMLYRALTGDTSDNVPGIKGIGINTLIKNVPEFNEKRLELQEFLDLCRDKLSANPKSKFFPKILEGVNDIERNISIIQLKDSIMSLHSKTQVMRSLEGKTYETNLPKLVELVSQDRIYSSIKDFPTWVKESFKSISVNG